tara:strand:+ start:37 stop:732 length:696 start_codon:yes stop_codon:yes gene_type:complete
MATLELNGKSLATQTSTAEPVIASTVTGAPALALTNATGTMPTGTQDNITRLGTVASGNLSNTAIVYPAGHVVKMSTLTGMGTDVQYVNDGNLYNWWPTSGTGTKYTPHGGSGNNTTIFPILYLKARCKSNGFAGHRVDQQIAITGDDITNVDSGIINPSHGTYDYGNSGGVFNVHTTMMLPSVTLDGTGKADISFFLSWRQNDSKDASTDWIVYANGTSYETHLVIMEVQ